MGRKESNQTNKLGKDKKRTAARLPHAGRTSFRDVIAMIKWRHHVASQRIQDFLEAFFHVFQYKMSVFSGEQEKESIIRVRMG